MFILDTCCRPGTSATLLVRFVVAGVSPESLVGRMFWQQTSGPPIRLPSWPYLGRFSADGGLRRNDRDDNGIEASMNSLELEIRRLVSRETGISIERVALTSTLGTDCGMDGIDAVDFFEVYEKEFKVDIGELWTEWPAYFCPEGWPPWGGPCIVHSDHSGDGIDLCY
jgi:Protein of unknown function (DUF1493)